MYKAAVLIALAATLGVVLGSGYQSSGYGTYRNHYNHEYYGHWGYWSEWSDCSVTCGGGTQSRSRECQRPHYGYGEYKGCEGDDSEERECNTAGCPVDGGWTEWGEYSDCSVDCGQGSKSRSRTCTNPEPANGGRDCYGDDTQTADCYAHKCPVYGHWSYWSHWSYCSVTCGGGTQSRSRECQRPYHVYGEYKGCEGDDTEERECNTDGCPVNGGWTEWGEYSDCSTDCGRGTKSRSRTCTDPEPANGGRDCYGEDTQTTYCHVYKCPVDGGWGHWSYWSSCSATCGEATRTRSRSCDYPEPAYGGADCEGDSSESKDCYLPRCYQGYHNSGYNGHRSGYPSYN